MNFIINMCVLSILLSVVYGFAVKTKMNIMGSLNRLCGNDNGASDKLPSCDCLKEFSVQGQFHVGHHRDLIGTNYSIQTNSFGDTEDIVYHAGTEIKDQILLSGVTKISGLKCVDNNGDTTELNPIYTYMVYISSSISYTHRNTYKSIEAKYDTYPIKYKLTYLVDVDEKNAATIDKVDIRFNYTSIYNATSLGSICNIPGAPRTLERSVWNFANILVLNSTSNCRMEKGTTFPLRVFKNIPVVIALNEPLECGSYSIFMEVNPPGLKSEMSFGISFTLDYNTFCAPLET